MGQSGTSKRVAEKIFDKLSCDIIQITDNMNWKGVFRFLKGGYYFSKNNDVEIKTSKNIEAYDELVLVSPLWVGSAVPVVKVFLKTTSQDKVNLVIISNGSNIKNRLG